jgi:hypothetical protein
MCICIQIYIYIYLVYPSFLICNETTPEVVDGIAHVNFCGLRIDCEERKYLVSVYDKKRDFSFRVINYPHTLSNIPETIVYSAFLGQLHRFYRICNTHTAFIRHITDLALSLIKRNGCSCSQLNARFSSFLHRSKWKYSIRKSTMRKMFSDTLRLIPLTKSPYIQVKPELKRRHTSPTYTPAKVRKKNTCLPSNRYVAKSEHIPHIILHTKTECLTDIIICNICAEIFSYVAPPVNSILMYPSTMSIWISNFEMNSRPIHTILSSQKITILTINTGAFHWVLLVIDNRPQEQCVVYWDPLGTPCPHSLYDAVNSRLPNHHFTDLNIRTQYEGFQCGVWTCWMTEQILYLHDRSLSQLTYDVYTNTDDIQEQRYNCAFIASVRDKYSTYLLTAYRLGTLSHS